eukprot:TRINITY_DN70722_c0_g1_i1.p1 TRINITY_DN70722_c0_g1~~TRINITY_DN70722_c0_g1_i1.p1  ORF type:complete len:269 (-),score=60.36 TRINITY_DN70722_c0_g1_i1:94-900(-)
MRVRIVAFHAAATIGCVLLLCGHSVSARSVGQLLLKRQSRQDLQGGAGGESLQTASLEFGKELAMERVDDFGQAASEQTDEELLTEELTPHDPYKAQTMAIMKRMDDWIARVRNAQKSAEAQRRLVVKKEATLGTMFMSRMQQLETSLHEAATDATKAETVALMERLSRIHYDQVAMLDRSARFWEARIAKEKEMTRLAEAKTRLEQFAASAEQIHADGLVVEIKHLGSTDKVGLEGWLTSHEQQLRSEEEAIQRAVSKSDPQDELQH